MKILKCKICVKDLTTPNRDLLLDKINIEIEFKKESLPHFMSQRYLMLYPRTINN